MRKFVYLFLLGGSVVSLQAAARDAHFWEGREGLYAKRVAAVSLPASEEDVMDESDSGPSPLQIALARDSIAAAVEEMTLADVLSGLYGRSSPLLEGWSSEEMSDFMLAFNDEYEALEIEDKKKKLRNLQGDLENIKGSKKKKKGKAAIIRDLEGRIESLQDEVAEFDALLNPEKMEAIKIDLKSSTHTYPWFLSVELELRTESGIPERFLRLIKAGLQYQIDIPA